MKEDVPGVKEDVPSKVDHEGGCASKRETMKVDVSGIKEDVPGVYGDKEDVPDKGDHEGECYSFCPWSSPPPRPSCCPPSRPHPSSEP